MHITSRLNRCSPLLLVTLFACEPPAPPSPPASKRVDEAAAHALKEKWWDERHRAREAELLREPDDVDAEVPESLPSAQRFLAKLVARGGVTIDAETDPGWNIGWDLQTPLRGKERIVSKKFRASTVLGSSDFAECTTVLRTHDPPNVTLGAHGERVTLESPIRGPVSLNWRRVTDVERDGAAVLVSGLHSKQLRRSYTFVPARMRLHVPSEEVATRVAYVFELLRVYCKEES